MEQGAYVSREEAGSSPLAEAINRLLNRNTPSNEAAREAHRIRTVKRRALLSRPLGRIRGSGFAAYRNAGRRWEIFVSGTRAARYKLTDAVSGGAAA